MAQRTKFLNIDLDLTGQPTDLDAVRTAFGDSVVAAVREDPECATLELNEQPSSVDAGLISLMTLIASFHPDSRRHWDALSERAMNIGILGGTSPYQAVFGIQCSTLRRLYECGANLLITVYEPEEY